MSQSTLTTVFATVPTADADDLASTLVDERFAACVNRFPCQSTYRWDGEVTTDEEAILLAKTTADRAPALVDRLREVHPYDVPCIERFDASSADDPFADWCGTAVRPAGD